MSSHAPKIEIEVGRVEGIWGLGSLTFSIIIEGGLAHVQVYAHNPKDMRKAGVLLTLNWQQWNDLGRVLSDTHAKLQQLHVAGDFSGFRQ